MVIFKKLSEIAESWYLGVFWGADHDGEIYVAIRAHVYHVVTQNY
jgi:hypothetical protein